MSLTVVKGTDLRKSPIGQLSNNTAIPWNTLLAPSNVWPKDLNMKRLEALAYDNTLYFQKDWKEEQEMAYFKKEKYVPSSHIHATSSIQQRFLLLILPLPSKCAVFHMLEVAKNESVSLLSSENLLLTGAGLLFIFHLTKPIFFSSHTSSICRPSFQQSQMPAKQTAVGGESSVAGISSLYSAGGQPVKHGKDTESNFLSSTLLPLLISKEGSWGHEQKDKTSMCAPKYAALIFI